MKIKRERRDAAGREKNEAGKAQPFDLMHCSFFPLSAAFRLSRSGGVAGGGGIFTRARVLLVLLSLRKDGDHS